MGPFEHFLRSPYVSIQVINEVVVYGYWSREIEILC